MIENYPFPKTAIKTRKYLGMRTATINTRGGERLKEEDNHLLAQCPALQYTQLTQVSEGAAPNFTVRSTSTQCPTSTRGE